MMYIPAKWTARFLDEDVIELTLHLEPTRLGRLLLLKEKVITYRGIPHSFYKWYEFPSGSHTPEQDRLETVRKILTEGE